MEVSVNNKQGSEEKARVVGVRFKPCGKVYSFGTGGLELKVGDKVVVESMFGLTIGTVVREDFAPPHSKELKLVVRKATEEDLKAAEENRSLEAEARRYCFERIAARGLPMKLVCTEATLDKKRIIFYFTADSRIDFRELVKDLASKFRTRIEMRQIGVRDEAKLIGGIGVCGRELCCRTFLASFAPISIRMAKKQALVLNTSKLSGVCGRLMCCLSYEYEGRLEEEIDETVLRDSIEKSLCEELPSESFVSPVTVEKSPPVHEGETEEPMPPEDETIKEEVPIEAETSAAVKGGMSDESSAIRVDTVSARPPGALTEQMDSGEEQGPEIEGQKAPDGDVTSGDSKPLKEGHGQEPGGANVGEASQEEKKAFEKKKRRYFKHRKKGRRRR